MSGDLGKCCAVIAWGLSQGRVMYRDCGKPAKAIVNGEPYCGTHNPQLKAKKRANQIAGQDKVRRRQRAYNDITYAAIYAAHGKKSWDDVKAAVAKWEGSK